MVVGVMKIRNGVNREKDVEGGEKKNRKIENNTFFFMSFCQNLRL